MKRLDPKNATDTQLLALFEQGRDQCAFAEIVRRYGPMVFATAKRKLHSRQDAEEAFQATFLALAKAADRLSSGEVLVAWLHNTARKTSSSMRRGLVRRNRLMERLMGQADTRNANIDTKNTNPAEAIANDEALEVLDEEISKLPTKLQAAIVLCHLDGLNQHQVAKQLGIPTSTVNDRLAKGRHALKMKLIRRGVTLTLAGVSTYIASSSDASAAISSSLVADTTAKSALYAAGRSASEIGVSNIVFHEANKVISAMTTSKFISVALVALAFVTLSGVLPGILGQQQGNAFAETVFLDSFSSEDFPGWSQVNSQGFVAELSESGDMSVESTELGGFVHQKVHSGNIAVRTRARLLSGFISTAFHYQDTPGTFQDSGYYIFFYSNGEFTINAFSNEDGEPFQTRSTNLPMSAPELADRDVEIEVSLLDNHIRGWVWWADEAKPKSPQLDWEINDSRLVLADGLAGLAGSAGSRFEVRDFEVRTVPEPRSMAFILALPMLVVLRCRMQANKKAHFRRLTH